MFVPGDGFKMVKKEYAEAHTVGAFEICQEEELNVVCPVHGHSRFRLKKRGVN
jgi:hypothetical protein